MNTHKCLISSMVTYKINNMKHAYKVTSSSVGLEQYIMSDVIHVILILIFYFPSSFTNETVCYIACKRTN